MLSYPQPKQKGKPIQDAGYRGESFYCCMWNKINNRKTAFCSAPSKCPGTNPKIQHYLSKHAFNICSITRCNIQYLKAEPFTKINQGGSNCWHDWQPTWSCSGLSERQFLLQQPEQYFEGFSAASVKGCLFIEISCNDKGPAQELSCFLHEDDHNVHYKQAERQPLLVKQQKATYRSQISCDSRAAKLLGRPSNKDTSQWVPGFQFNSPALKLHGSDFLLGDESLWVGCRNLLSQVCTTCTQSY